MSEAPGPLNFTMFLTLFGEKLTGEGNVLINTNTEISRKRREGGGSCNLTSVDCVLVC